MPPSPSAGRPSDFREAFLEAERQVRINTGKLACALVVVLMPFGAILDYFVFGYGPNPSFPEVLVPFLGLRLLCSALVRS